MVFAKSYSNLDSWTTITVQKTMLCNFQNVSEAAGSVQFRDGKYAEIMVNEKWTPICGPCFWDNDFGASLFCRKLDSKYMSGYIGNTIAQSIGGLAWSGQRNAIPLTSEGYKIGTCLIGDTNLLSCSGESGAGCYTSTGCGTGSEATVEIKCLGM